MAKKRTILTRKANAKTGNYFSSILRIQRMGKQEDRGVVAIVCSFPFIPDGKKECQNCPQYVLRWYLDLQPFMKFNTQANTLAKRCLCFNTLIKPDLVSFCPPYRSESFGSQKTLKGPLSCLLSFPT